MSNIVILGAQWGDEGKGKLVDLLADRWGLTGAGRVRAEVIRDQLAYLRSLIAPLNVRMTIDVFGLTATDTTDSVAVCVST